MIMNMNCPCGSDKDYKKCCGYFHEKTGYPSTAEALMRSRYSAYVLNKEKYLLYTWHKSKRPELLNLKVDGFKWLELQILSKKAGEENDFTGVVEFKAKYSAGSNVGYIHEISNFVKEDSKWFYVDGVILET